MIFLLSNPCIETYNKQTTLSKTKTILKFFLFFRNFNYKHTNFLMNQRLLCTIIFKFLNELFSNSNFIRKKNSKTNSYNLKKRRNG